MLRNLIKKAIFLGNSETRKTPESKYKGNKQPDIIHHGRKTTIDIVR